MSLWLSLWHGFIGRPVCPSHRVTVGATLWAEVGNRWQGSAWAWCGHLLQWPEERTMSQRFYELGIEILWKYITTMWRELTLDHFTVTTVLWSSSSACRVDPCILDPLKNMADCGETRSCMHSELIRHERGLLNAMHRQNFVKKIHKMYAMAMSVWTWKNGPIYTCLV